MSRKIEVATVTDVVRQRIREMILDGDLSPGTKILQDQIAKELGVSKTPVLKALHVLETENLVLSIARRGFFVREFTTREIAQIFAVREIVEAVAAEEAARSMTVKDIERLKSLFAPFTPPLDAIDTEAYLRADQKFHSALVAAADNQFIQQINQTINVVPISYQPGLLRLPEETLPEHYRIIAAIANRDPIRARQEAMDHHYRTRLGILKRLGDNGATTIKPGEHPGAVFATMSRQRLNDG